MKDQHEPVEEAAIDPIAMIQGEMRNLANRLNDLIQLQKMALLDPGHVLRFVCADEEIALCIPLAQTDFIQRNILKSGSFYELPLLEKLRS